MQQQAPQESISLSQNSIVEEYDTTTGDAYVAWDKVNEKLVTNQDIYASAEDVTSAMEQFTFTSHIVGDLKELFDERFEGYKTQLQEMGKIAPQTISTTLENTVSQFFTDVDNQIKAVEQNVLKRIQQSTNLQELEELLTKEKQAFGLDLEKVYEGNRTEIEDRIKSGHFSEVVRKKETYENLIGDMQGHQEAMARVVEEGQKKIERIMTIKQGPEA